MSGVTHTVLSETMVKVTTELGAEVVHLHAHTDGLQDIISDELEKLQSNAAPLQTPNYFLRTVSKRPHRTLNFEL